MKQILQSLKDGKTYLDDLPAPTVSFGSILIKTTHSLVSLGTEKMLVEFSRANIVQKARQQPEKVKQVLDKIKAEGLMPTIETIYRKLDEPIPLGYCNVGKVIAVGDGVDEFCIGDRVASNGPHAEIVSVRKNLAVKIPDSVSDEEAAFTVVGSIALQGIRLIKPTFGETVAVMGLGLIGLITSQLLKANGCRVIGIDINSSKCDLAKEHGIDVINSDLADPIKLTSELTKEIGCDGVIITASSKSDTLISQAAKISRKKGRIVLVGVIGMNMNRADFYDKELSFQVSCSYGAGRYDPSYEEIGIDYPLPYVRWTEKRNFEAVIQSISSGQLKIDHLITQRCSFENFNKIYSKISSDNSIASILNYDNNNENSSENELVLNEFSFKKNKGIIGIIGAGNFTKMTALPSLKKTNAIIKTISSKNGLNSTFLAKKYKISKSVSDNEKIFNDNDIDTVIITTRHDSHSKLVIDSLKCRKNVFVEKPLAIKKTELNDIKKAISNAPDSTLTVGYNRRFSPHIKKIKKYLISNQKPSNIIANMNSGFIPKDHWVHDKSIGGGRIIGEACHLIDICVFLTGSMVEYICMNNAGLPSESNTDNASLLLRFKNGSNATINYFSNGSKKYSKERIEVYNCGSTFIVDNYRKTEAYDVKNFKSLKTKIDKGHINLFKEFIKLSKFGGEALIPINEIFNVSEASFAAIESLKNKKWVKVI